MDVLSSVWPWVQPMIRQPLVSSEPVGISAWASPRPLSVLLRLRSLASSLTVQPFLQGFSFFSLFPGRFVFGLSLPSSYKGFFLLKLQLVPTVLELDSPTSGSGRCSRSSLQPQWKFHGIQVLEMIQVLRLECLGSHIESKIETHPPTQPLEFMSII